MLSVSVLFSKIQLNLEQLLFICVRLIIYLYSFNFQIVIKQIEIEIDKKVYRKTAKIKLSETVIIIGNKLFFFDVEIKKSKNGSKRFAKKSSQN